MFRLHLHNYDGTYAIVKSRNFSFIIRLARQMEYWSIFDEHLNVIAYKDMNKEQNHVSKH